MDKPADERATINVKAVSVSAWERAKIAAQKQGETMGSWLSRAINHLADMEAGPREFPPANPEAQRGPGMSVEDVGTLMRSLAALAQATGVPPAKADIRRAYGLADELIRDARGQPRKRPRPSRLAGLAERQSLLENGKAAALAWPG